MTIAEERTAKQKMILIRAEEQLTILSGITITRGVGAVSTLFLTLDLKVYARDSSSKVLEIDLA